MRMASSVEQAFGRHVDDVYHYFYQWLGNREDAERLTAEAFRLVAARRSARPGDEPLEARLFRIARRVLEGYFGSESRHATGYPFAELLGKGSSEHSGTDRTRSELRASLAGVLETLPEQLRRILELRFQGGYSLSETARILAIPPESVSALQTRALRRAVELAAGRRSSDRCGVR